MAGSSVRKLVVQVVDARNLLPKDGHGTSSPYVILDFYGQRRKTRSVNGDLNPVWNDTVSFDVGKPSTVFGDILEVDVYHDKNVGPTTRNNFLGRVRLDSRQFVRKGEEALIYYPLEKKNFFSWIQGEIGLKIYFLDQVIPPPEPPPLPLPTEEIKSDPPPETAETPTDPAGPAPQSAAEPPASSNSDPPGAPPPAEAATEPPQPPSDKAGSPSSQPPAEAEPLPPQTTEAVEELAENATVESDHKQPSAEAVNNPEGQLDPDQVMASMASATIPGVKVSGIYGPRPISRAGSVSSFISDASDNISIERHSFDLVDKMHYLFIRVVKARTLPTAGNPVVKIVVSGSQVTSKPARKSMFFEWDQTFAFSQEAADCILEVSVWDSLISSSTSEMASHNFLGGICFDVTEIPLRDPPDSPLAPQWYRLEGGGAHRGDLMLATWIGTQADESFQEAWKNDTPENSSSQSKIYQSPKLWYLRSTVMEAQDISSGLGPSRESSSFQIKAQLGFQIQKTKVSLTRNGSCPSWNEDLMFVSAEPFGDQQLLFFLVEYPRESPKQQVVIAVTSIPLISIERRVDNRNVASRWFTFEDPNQEKKNKVYKGRVQLRVCFDGGYHVMDEAAHVCSDYRPTAKQLWKPPVGTVELGISGCKNLLPMKTINRKGCTDAYAVARYGNKWVRTRTVSDTLDPRWNEQYTWRVYDPSTVLTIGVFDSSEVFESDDLKESMRPDLKLGKVRIRISTLETGKVYKNTYPLLLLSPSGLKKMGEIEVAVRFARVSPTLDILHLYSMPLLPIMHYIKPIGVMQQEVLRSTAVKIVCAHLSRSEPPLRREVITYMLDADSQAFSMRKVRANWFRIINVIAGIIDIIKWIEDTCAWKNPTATILVHALLVMLVWFPDLIIPTLAFYMFVVGVWNYRLRSRNPLPHFDPKISLADTIDGDELDEEFDVMPCSRSNESVRARYDKLRMLGARVQTVLGDFATQGERVQALVTWRDPRATGIFIGLCFVVAFILYLVPSKMVAMALGLYYLRHPIFRDRMPSPALNFFRRLPSLSDRIL